MTTRISILLRNEDGRSSQASLLAKANIEVTIAGSGTVAKEASSTPGLHVFMVSGDEPGTEMMVSCRVGPFGQMTTPLLDATQKFRFVLVAGKRGGKPSKALEAIPENGRLIHPRFVHNVGVSTGKGLDFRVTIDAEFLFVTEYAKTLQLYTQPAVRRIAELKEFARNSKCRLQIVEHTRSVVPRVWLLLFSPNFDPKTSNPNGLLFYRPELIDPNAQYKCADDAPYDRMFRYLRGESVKGSYYIAGNSDPLYPFRECGFDAQIAASGKSLIALFPIPHRTDFGALKDQRLTARGGVLDRLLRALWAEGLVGVGQATPPKVKRLALSGFSMGGDICLDAFKANRENVDELYLFDPGQGIAGDVVNWIESKPNDRRLRMMGTAYSEETALRHAASILKNGKVPSGNWSVYPGDGAFWYKDSGYFHALSDPGTGVERFNNEGDAPSTPATVKSNLFVASEQLKEHTDAPAENTITLAGHWTDASGRRGTANQRITGVSSVEAASLVRHHLIDAVNSGFPVTSVQQFNKVIAGIQHNDWNQEQPRIKALRHEWAVIGGTNSGGHFTGYLQMCLRDSGFA